MTMVERQAVAASLAAQVTYAVRAPMWVAAPSCSWVKTQSRAFVVFYEKQRLR